MVHRRRPPPLTVKRWLCSLWGSGISMWCSMSLSLSTSIHGHLLELGGRTYTLRIVQERPRPHFQHATLWSVAGTLSGMCGLLTSTATVSVSEQYLAATVAPLKQ